MKTFLKVALLAIALLAATKLPAAADKIDEKNLEFLPLNKVQALGDTKLISVAFDTASNEFVWKDYDLETPAQDWQFIGVENLDTQLRAVKSGSDLASLLEFEGTYFKLRKVGDTVALSYELTLKGGGLFSISVCSAACQVISSTGCTGGTLLFIFLAPPVGVALGLICGTTNLSGLSLASCIAGCTALDGRATATRSR